VSQSCTQHFLKHRPRHQDLSVLGLTICKTVIHRVTEVYKRNCQFGVQAGSNMTAYTRTMDAIDCHDWPPKHKMHPSSRTETTRSETFQPGVQSRCCLVMWNTFVSQAMSTPKLPFHSTHMSITTRAARRLPGLASQHSFMILVQPCPALLIPILSPHGCGNESCSDCWALRRRPKAST
jgi:hypothetical protein